MCCGWICELVLVARLWKGLNVGSGSCEWTGLCCCLQYKRRPKVLFKPAARRRKWGGLQGVTRISNAWLSITLKRILNQERPVASLGYSPGMPSSHAQSIFFASVYAILSLIKSLGLNGVTVTIGVLGLAFSSYLSWLRISQRHHTISQVVVGAILGTICSILWFQSWYWFVLQAFLSFLW
ncbi:lipid phosphate phosphatase epsilon 2, chloroplastic-like isoform X2 [Papaver somniferum]|nr:lipid phosphate phosphatase epsilon 2, chloroplastic-like isoform X2 [Papaver somniferum]